MAVVCSFINFLGHVQGERQSEAQRDKSGNEQPLRDDDDVEKKLRLTIEILLKRNYKLSFWSNDCYFAI